MINKTQDKPEKKLNFCPCCTKEKDVSKFFINKSKTAYSKFCKTCYIDYSKQERKINEMKYINSCILSLI